MVNIFIVVFYTSLREFESLNYIYLINEITDIAVDNRTSSG